MNQPTQPTAGKPSQPDTSQEPRAVRAAALLNAIPTLSALALAAAMAGPKLPPLQGD